MRQIWLLVLFISSNSFSSSVAISPSYIGAPAVDLVLNGQILDRDEALDLQNQGTNLSLLDPAPNDVWNPKNLPAPTVYPDGHPTLEFDSLLSSPRDHFLSRVKYNDSQQQTRLFRLVVSLNIHMAMVRAELLRKLGYQVPKPKYFSEVTLKFADLDARKKYLDRLSSATLRSRDRWVKTEPKDVPLLVLQDVVLEDAQVDFFPFHWGIILDRVLKGRRAHRASIVPLALTEIPQNINVLSWSPASIVSQAVVLTTPYASNFNEITFQDAQWITLRLSQLTRQDFQEIALAGSYPDGVARLLTEKLISRRNEFIKIFQVAGNLPSTLKKIDYDPTLTVGDIIKGKLNGTHNEGHAEEFTSNDPDSPIRGSEIARYLTIEGISMGLSQATGQLNDLMTIWKIEDSAKKRQDELKQNFINHIINNPGKPFSKSLGTWSGPFGGANVSASRNVVTGTYYGSDSPVQMVDTLSYGVNVGYFLGIDGVEKMIPGISGNLGIQRNYTHVRPISDIKTALTSEWSWLYVPTFIKKLTNALEGKAEIKDTSEIGQPIALDKAKAEDLSSETKYKAFLDEMLPGEVLTVTDTLLAGIHGNVNVPIDGLIGLSPIGFNNGINFGAGVSGTILARTTFHKTADGIQVYIQRVKTAALDFSFDVTYWMKIMGFNHENKIGDAKTKAFIMDQKQYTEEDYSKLIPAIEAVFKNQEIELLEKELPPFKLAHEVTTATTDINFLFFQASGVKETHKVVIEPPHDPSNNFRPEDFQKTLMSYKVSQAAGINYYAFLNNVIAGAVSGLKLTSGSGGHRPGNSFMGHGTWWTVSTEADLTPNQTSEPVSIIDHHWSGWILPKKTLFEILDGIENQVKNLNLTRPLFNRDEFIVMNSLQLYDIKTSLLIYESGVKKIRDILFNSGDANAVNQKLIEIEGREKVESWCHSEYQKQSNAKIPSYPTYVEYPASGKVWIGCAYPWIREVLRHRTKYPTTLENQVKWNTKLFAILDRSLSLKALMDFLGEDSCFFEVKVNGFRTHDQNTDMEVVGDSIGTFNRKREGGVFDQYAKKYKIMSHELEASYLSEGF